jgi:hypothetical protein
MRTKKHERELCSLSIYELFHCQTRPNSLVSYKLKAASVMGSVVEHHYRVQEVAGSVYPRALSVCPVLRCRGIPEGSAEVKSLETG